MSLNILKILDTVSTYQQNSIKMDFKSSDPGSD